MSAFKSAAFFTGAATLVGAGIAGLIMSIVAAAQLTKLLAYAVIAFPLMIVWNALAPVYFTALPPVYLDIPYLHVVGFLWLFGTLKGVVASAKSTNTVTQTNNAKG